MTAALLAASVLGCSNGGNPQRCLECDDSAPGDGSGQPTDGQTGPRPSAGQIVLYDLPRTYLDSYVSPWDSSLSTKYKYQAVEIIPALGVVTSIDAPYEAWSDQNYFTRAPRTYGGRIFLEYSSDGYLSLTELQPHNLAFDLYMAVDNGPFRVLGVIGKLVYLQDVGSIHRFSWRQLSEDVSAENTVAEHRDIQWPQEIPDRTNARCELISERLFCFISSPPAIEPPLCNDACSTAFDGVCQTPNAFPDAPELATCELGSDCGDCGPETTTTVCLDTCGASNNGSCNDDLQCAYGTDCSDCGVRPVLHTWHIPLAQWNTEVYEVDLSSGAARKVLSSESGAYLDRLLSVRQSQAIFSVDVFTDGGSPSFVELWQLEEGKAPNRLHRFEPLDHGANQGPPDRGTILSDVDDGTILITETGGGWAVYDLTRWAEPIASGPESLRTGSFVQF